MKDHTTSKADHNRHFIYSGRLERSTNLKPKHVLEPIKAVKVSCPMLTFFARFPRQSTYISKGIDSSSYLAQKSLQLLRLTLLEPYKTHEKNQMC